MTTALAFTILLVATLILLLLPFLPGFIVLWRKLDATPLRIVRTDDVDARFFARRFRAYLQKNIEPKMHDLQQDGSPHDDWHLGKTTPLVITQEHRPDFNDPEYLQRGINKVVVSDLPLELPGDLIFSYEIFSRETVTGGERNIYRAILADGEIHLGAESMLLRWLHAAGTVRIDRDTMLHGRVTSDSLIRLETGCRFERLHAPRIEFGSPLAINLEASATTPLEPKDIPHLADVTGRRWLIDHNVELPPSRIIPTDLVFTGAARIGAGSRIQGSVKGHKDVFLGEGVHVLGSVVSNHDIHIGPGCVIHGPVLSEKRVHVGKGVMIGDSGTPTTLSAREIVFSCGVVAHGTVWARMNGQVTGGAV